MGGSLLGLGRKNRKEYQAIENTVRVYLNNKIGANNFSIPRYYNEKPTFGDLDILVNDAFRRNDEFKSNFAKDLNSKFTKNSGVIVSNNIQNFQVDLFFFNKQYLQMASDFMDYNIGNFIGKIAKRFNLKYGDHGLYYVYRRKDNDHYISEFHITNDIEKILTFFDLKYDKWKNGFNTNIDSFKWIISSKYFSSYTYFKPTANNKKRIEFETFMDWLVENNITKDFDNRTISDEDKITLINKHFDINLNEFIDKEILKEERSNIIYNKFNGNIVMQLTELKGKDLGIFLKNFKLYCEKEYDSEFNNYLFYKSKKEILKEVLNYYFANYSAFDIDMYEYIENKLNSLL